MVTTVCKSKRLSPTKRRHRDPIDEAGRSPAAGLVVSKQNPPAAGLLQRVAFDVTLPVRSAIECWVGEGRRCVCSFRLREVAPQLFEVLPLYVRVCGGGRDLLQGRSEQGQPIPGRFQGLLAANDAAVAWASTLNEVAD